MLKGVKLSYETCIVSPFISFMDLPLSGQAPVNNGHYIVFQDDGLSDVAEMVRQERPFPERRLRGVLEELATSCSRYVTLTQGKASASGGRTKLDKDRLKLSQREIVSQPQQYTRSKDKRYPVNPLLIHAAIIKESIHF